ncbi:MAG TPA: hypothetical protein VGI81_16860 [Tepidisphaeraceae bacterium]|jgi:tetratricopeptide (TPR) repeat protein
MTTFPLQLRPIDATAAAPAAWLIPGDDPAVWLAEIGGWGVPMMGLRLFVLPRSLRDCRAAGVLVTGAEGLRRECVRRGQAYQLLAGRLYLPADARLDPPVSEAELREKLVWEVQVLHPSIGLVGYRREDAIRVQDLLAPPSRLEADWDRAARPTVVAPRLVTVEPEQPPTVEIIIESARGDIGSEAPDALPPADDESAIDDFLKRAARPGLKTIEWLTSNAGAGALPLPANWIARLRQWARDKREAIDRALLDARHRELQRLRKLFETDVDEALRFAIPFRDTGSRGRAAPGRRLGPRTPLFDLVRLGGGRPADFWDIPPDTQRDLTAKYRAAANRELNLGRYRRAAYIFAELLGDYAAAANALQQGRFFREAATLYLEKLHNKPAAAKCLKEGGVLAEAVVLYEELGEYVEAGVLYTQLERPDEAKRCYRLAVDHAIDRDAFLDAAKLLEFKLDAADEAAALLLSQWPGSYGAASCLSAYFDVLSRHDRHEDAHRRVALLRDELVPDARVEPLAGILSSLSTKYPEPDVRALAADATRVVAGRRLAIARGPEAKALVDAVTRLCPEDRLLRRDAARYLDSGPPVYQLAPAKPKTRLVSQFKLPGSVTWNAVASIGDTFFAAGIEGQHRTVIVRGGWYGTAQKINWANRVDGTWALEPNAAGRSLLLIPLGDQPMATQSASFPPYDGFPEPCRAGVPPWLPGGQILGSGRDENDNVWIVHRPAGGPFATLSAFRAETPQLLATLGPIELFGRDASDGTFIMFRENAPVVARQGHVVVASGRALFHWRPARSGSSWFTGIDLPHPATALVGSPPFTGVRVAVAFENGGIVIWPEGPQKLFGQDMTFPQIGFTRGGLLVAVGGGEARVYRTDGFKVRLQTSFPVEGPEPIAVCPARKLDEFGLITPDGLVRVFDVSDARAT